MPCSQLLKTGSSGIPDEPEMELVRVLQFIGVDTKADPEQAGPISL